jgi:hypothetical protein
MNDVQIIFDDISRIGIKSPDAEVRVVGKTFWTACTPDHSAVGDWGAEPT